MKTIKTVMIGVGNISGIYLKNIHETFHEIELIGVCDLIRKRAEKAQQEYGVPRIYETMHDAFADPEVEMVLNLTRPYEHFEVSRAALEAGKPVNLEKPIAMHGGEAAAICAAQKKNGLPGMTCFSYRFKPAVRYAKHLVESGSLGRIVGLNVAYLKDSALWEGRRLEWRFVKEYANSGVIGDLGVHLIDLAQLLAGQIDGVFAMQKTVVTERPLLDGSGTGKVETEDMCGFLASFACGAQGTFHITRAAAGYKNTIRYDVYGTKGAISFDLDHPEHLSVCCGEGDLKQLAFRTVEVPGEFYLDQEEAFIHALQGKDVPLFPTLEDGAQGQRVIDALLRSAEEQRWVSL